MTDTPTLGPACDTLATTLDALTEIAASCDTRLTIQYAQEDDGRYVWIGEVTHDPDVAFLPEHEPGAAIPHTQTSWATYGERLLPVLAMVRHYLATLETAATDD